MDPLLRELIEEGDSEEELEVILKLRPEAPPPPDVRIITRFGDIATARVRRGRVQATWTDEAAISVKAPRLVGPEIDAVPAQGEPVFAGRPRPEGANGQGIVIGVIDWGCDFAHPNLRHGDGSTRLLALWDQSNNTRLIKPSPYGYGALHTAADINQALLDPRPYAALGYHPGDSDPLGDGAHGTHVCDIAAGNGRVPGSPIGLAPMADLVFVHLAASRDDGRVSLGDTSRVLEALHFISVISGERPFVINLSVGRCGGPHTGLTLVEQGIDQLLLLAPGRCVVHSTGNYFATRGHAAGQLRPGEARSLNWQTDRADVTPNELEVWYPSRDLLTVELRAPGSDAVIRVARGDDAPVMISGRDVGHVYHRASDPSNGDHHIDIFLDPSAPSGSWQVRLVAEDVVDGRFHAWIERDAACPSCQSHLASEDVAPFSTTGTICNGFRSIAVGAYDLHRPDMRLAAFSSSGPTRDGRQKPDLIAPGVGIVAARSTPPGSDTATALVTTKSGTSMAAPHVTGAVACMFEAANRPLWIHETRAHLLGTATPTDPQGSERARVGSGMLDASAAAASVREVSPPRVVVPLLTNSSATETAAEGEVAMRIEGTAEAALKRHFVLVSGGPGPFDTRDIEHDKSWANYVTPPLLMSDTPDEIVQFVGEDEDVWWFVYRPAYERRWEDDSASKDPRRKKAVADVRNGGFSSYIDKIKLRAQARGWNFRWLNDAPDFWAKLHTFRDRSLSRVLYWGHASSGNLWLTVSRAEDGGAAEPEKDEVIRADTIVKTLASKRAQGVKRISRFIGCNTADFAQRWATTFQVEAEGIDGKVNFESIHREGFGSEPCLVEEAKALRFAPDGTKKSITGADSSYRPCPASLEESEQDAEVAVDADDACGVAAGELIREPARAPRPVHGPVSVSSDWGGGISEMFDA